MTALPIVDPAVPILRHGEPDPEADSLDLATWAAILLDEVGDRTWNPMGGHASVALVDRLLSLHVHDLPPHGARRVELVVRTADAPSWSLRVEASPGATALPCPGLADPCATARALVGLHLRADADAIDPDPADAAALLVAAEEAARESGYAGGMALVVPRGPLSPAVARVAPPNASGRTGWTTTIPPAILERTRPTVGLLTVRGNAADRATVSRVVGTRQARIDLDGIGALDLLRAHAALAGAGR